MRLNKILSRAAVGFLWEDGESSYNGMYTDFEYDRKKIPNRKVIIYKPETFLNALYLWDLATAMFLVKVLYAI